MYIDFLFETHILMVNKTPCMLPLDGCFECLHTADQAEEKRQMMITQRD